MNIHEKAAARIEAYRAKDALLRRAWTVGDRGPDGYERACLLAAMVPEVGDAKNSAKCPSALMPEWLARMTIWFDDDPSAEAWPRVIEEYVACIRRSGAMTPDAWHRLDCRFRLVAVESARALCPADNTDALAAIDAAIDLLRRVVAGEGVDTERWEHVERVVLNVYKDTSGDASRSTWAAYQAVIFSSTGAATETTDAAVYAARLAPKPEGADWDRMVLDFIDRMVFAMLAAWRDELDKVEAAR